MIAISHRRAGFHTCPSRYAAAIESYPKALLLALLCALWLAATALAGQDVLVRLETGATEEALQAAINAVIKAGGGWVLVKPGTYQLHRGLRLSNAKDVSLIGEPGARLVFAPEVHTVAAADAAQGQSVVQVESVAGLAAGMTLEIQAPGHTYESPDGKKHVCPYFGATVASVSGNQVTTTRPLQYAVPKGAKLMHLYSALVLSGRTSNVLIEGLEMDLNRDAWPVRPINHSEHCAVFAAGLYDYEKGPTGPPIERVTIRNCVLRNSHHRGVAFYSVVRSSVVGCRIENAGDEAIDFDHFCFHCEARDNDIRNAPVGVELNDPSDCVVENNRIDGCESGIRLWRWCKGEELNLRNVFRSNVIANSKNVALFCGPKTAKTLIAGNTVRGSRGRGLYIAGDENTVEGNLVCNCAQEAILLVGSRNVVRGNDCKDNAAPPRDAGNGNQVSP